MRGRVAAGTFTDHPATGNAPQRDDMIAEAARLGFKVDAGAPPGSTPQQAAVARPAQPAQPVQTPVSPIQPAADRRTSGAPTLPSGYTPAATRQPSTPEQDYRPTPPAANPPLSTHPAPPSGGTTPHKPDRPFQRGVKRPGVSSFISGSRRR